MLKGRILSPLIAPFYVWLICRFTRKQVWQATMAEPRALAELIDAIKNSLGLDAGLSVTAALRQANTTLGLASQGTLPAQVRGAPPHPHPLHPHGEGCRGGAGTRPCAVAPVPHAVARD